MTVWIGSLVALVLVASNVLTWIFLARTLRMLKSDPPPPVDPPEPVSETDPDTGDAYRVWADDVLAEEEQRMRKTAGAAAHSSDVCTYWDEEDQRQADDELMRRTLRSMRGP